MSSTLSKIAKRIRRRARKKWKEAQLRSRGKLASWEMLSDETREYIVDQIARRPMSRVLTPDEAAALRREARTLEVMRGQPRKIDFESDWGATTWTVEGTDQHGNRISEVVRGSSKSVTLFSTVDSITVLQWKPLPKP